MTRFKEKRRIDNAIAHKDMRELEWAKRYAKSRIEIATMKEHVKYWNKVLNQIQKALGDS